MLKTLRNKIIKILTLLFIVIINIPPTPALAGDFDISITRTFSVDDSREIIHIEEERVISNNTSTYYIPQSTKETFLIQNFKKGFSDREKALKEDSIRITNSRGEPLDYTKELIGQNIQLEVRYPYDLSAHDELVIKLEYDTNELIEKVGQVTNIYIPGLEKDFQSITTSQSGAITQEVSYNTRLKVPNELETHAFTVPLPTDTTKQNGTTIHEFNTESILGKSVWHQIGDSQIYKFKITQPTIKTDEFTPEQLGFLSQNKYTMILPRKYDETNQEILFTNIDPQPETLKKDRNGNLVASFLVDATKKEEILIEGFITVELEESGNRHSLPESVDIARLDQFGDMEKYLQSSEFWQVDAPEIQAKAKELAGDSENIMEILEADYKFIVDSIDYDDFKYGDRNKRQGALKTLGGGDSVCMEYSDLLITLLRAQGIPARAAYGYGYDPQFAPDNQESHQWVQAWVPDYGWLTIDPTWGETGRDFIGKDLDHALWYVASEHPDNPAPLEVTSSFSDFTVEQSQIEIVAVEKLPEDIDYKSIAQLQQDIPLQQAKVEEISEKIRVSPVGKSFIIIIPSCLGVLILIVFLSSVVKFLKGKNRASKAGKQSNYPGQPSQ